MAQVLVRDNVHCHAVIDQVRLSAYPGFYDSRCITADTAGVKERKVR